jgi:type I restriction enzyme S subunit
MEGYFFSANQSGNDMKYSAYPKYKKSGVEWLGDVPAHWEVERLQYQASINDEAYPETMEPDFEILYVDISSVDSVNGIIKKEPMIFENAPSRARRIVRDGDTIISTVRTYLRAIAPVEKPEANLTASTGFAVIRPRLINKKYLSKMITAPFFVEEIVSRSVGVSYPAINASDIGLIAIPVPSFSEQRAIAEFLDRETGRIDELITKKERLIDLLKEKRTALISHAVTKGLNPKVKMKPSGVEWLGDVPEHWEVSRFRRLICYIRNGTSTTQVEETDCMLPVTRIETISKGIIDFDKIGFVEPFHGSEQFRLKKGDLLLSHINSLSMIGNCAIYCSDLPLYSGMNLLRIIPNGQIHPKWLWYFVVHDGFKKTLSSRAKPAINQASLTTNQIKEMIIVIPTYSEQQSIAAFLDRETNKIDALISKVETAITKLKEYRTALISAAVTGKIDVSTRLNTGGQEVA